MQLVSLLKESLRQMIREIQLGFNCKDLLKNKYKISVYDRTVSKIDQKKLKLKTADYLSKSKYSALLILNNDDNYKKYLKKHI